VSQDEVEITRRIFEAASRRDADALLSLYAQEAVLEPGDVGFATFEGVDAIRAFIEDWWSSYADYEAEASEIVHLDEGVVLTVNTLKGRLSDGGEPLRLYNAFVFLFEDGLVVRMMTYEDIDRARAAAERLAEERR
jgi:ketosteroid isomerase-like protein